MGFLACQLIALLGLAGGQAWLSTVAYTAVQLIALFGIPAAMTIAILLHRLYDIDVIISRAVVYGLLSAVVHRRVRGHRARHRDVRGRAWSCATPRSPPNCGRRSRTCGPPADAWWRAQDAERRRIERNLHDGAQQQLIALTIHLALLEESADDPAAVRELVPAVKDGVRAALDDLRDLARGIYPPVLADHGLIPALQAQARKVALPVEIDADGIGRYPQDTEAAVYFCTLEALQNITKYASASRATVGLSCSDGSLQFTVTDDGTGFDTATTRHGTGLQGMADRLAALGGALHVRSRPGEGTTLSGELPVSALG